jgi:GcrA cell cycle regulator
MTIQHRTVDVEAASKLWRDDFSASQIAKRFGVSRNVIVGIAFRNRAFFPEKPRSRRTRAIKAAPAPRKDETSKPPFTPHEREPVAATEYDVKRLPFAKPLEDLLPGECKWPVTNGSPYLFCAARTDGKYCQHHQSRALATQRIKKQR